MTTRSPDMTYADYLNLPTVLSAQQSLSGLHDETLFIVMHQTMELWMKQMLHEVTHAIRLIGADDFAAAYKVMARMSRIEAVMTLSWDVLATMTPVEFGSFRHVLGKSSGFQSAQFRELEFRLGLKEERFLGYHPVGSEDRARLQAAMDEPSLWEAAVAARDRHGVNSWLTVYRDPERWFPLYQLAEKLVDIDEGLSSWRHKHLITVERIIGNKQGTGGSAGARYLASTVPKRAFPELWALRTDL